MGTTGAGTYISACNGNSGGTIATGVVGEVILDWNGDGRDDLLYVNGSTWYVAISTGNGYATGVSTGIPYTYVPLANWIALDTNGDGLTDWATVNASGNIVYGLHNGAGQPPDLVNEITDGYGNTVSPTYVSIAQSNYTPETYATYPYLNYIGPLYVVSEAIFSDPSNPPSGTYNQSYAYYGAAVNLQGRGFADFCCINMLDSRNALSYRAYYMQVFPYIGMEYKNFIRCV